MLSRQNVILIGATCLLSAPFGPGTVAAHNWGCWRQPNRTVKVYNTAALFSQADAALSEWDSKTILAIPRQSSHTEVSVFDGYYGNTGWAGIASIESYSGCNILHGHARVNRSYSYTSNGYRGIFCQEVGHLFGLDHSNDGGCMGGGYFYSINTYYTVVQHNVNDIANKYAGVPLATVGDVADQSTQEPRAVAFWHERPQTLQQAAARSQAVVVGHVAAVKAGPDLTVETAALEGGVDRIPTQRITIAVERVLAGEMALQAFELFHTGNAEFVVDEDPAYAVGERWVLFVTPADNGTYRVVAPEGRLQVTATGLGPVTKGVFMSDLRGSSVESLSQRLAGVAPSEGEPQGSVQFRRLSDRPFGAETPVSYSLPQASAVKLQVFDVRGRFVRTLVDAHQDAGVWYTVEWNGTDELGKRVANGVYYIRLQTRDVVKSLSVIRVN